MTLKYKVTFYDYWHLSSGLSAGAKLDSSVVKDSDSIPFIPGKTIKGLAKEMAQTLKKSESFVKECFGVEGVENGACYFANATLDAITKEEIVSNKLQDNLYDIIASTSIGENGVAIDDTLREIEVVVPMTLEGEVLDIPSVEYGELLIESFQKIMRMGLNRNRGLGRCEFIVEAIK